MKLISLFLLGVLGSSAAAQQITVDLSGGAPYVRHFSVETADGSAAATPEEVNAVNEKLLAAGNKQAAWELGLAYLQGVGTAPDLAKAAHYFDVGATRPEQQAFVGEFYEHGEYFQKNADEAAKWFLAAGRPGDLFELAQQYRLAATPDLAKAAALYRKLLEMPGHPEVRRAQMELGNLVLDGKYSAGEDAKGRALNLDWAKVITQELLGQEDYKIAVDYDIGREGLEKNRAMWERYCKRAASYNIDLAQSFYGKALLDGEISPPRPYEGYAWLRLSSDKMYANREEVKKLEAGMTEEQIATGASIFEGLEQTRVRDGAYYPAGEPLREPSASQLAKMPDDDPDVQLRRAFALEQGARAEDYGKAMDLYRRVRDRRKVDVRLVLWREYRDGTDGVAKDPQVAKHWLEVAANEGSGFAELMLARDPKAAKEFRAQGDPLRPAAPPGVLHVGGGVLPPRALRAPSPSYTAEARRAHFSGGVRVYLIVDENGNPMQVKVMDPVGMGLDESAVDAVKQYKFSPATLNGKPVKVDMYVDVKWQTF